MRTIPLVAALAMSAALSGEQPRELGKVRWERDFAAAKASAKRAKKPLLVLFDEVPG